ncbi:MAG: dihydrofolate reductase [Mangrovibacterium sp.]
MKRANNLALIVAMTANQAIGKDNRLLFHLPDDLKRFKTITSGHPLIMGRKTLLSLPQWPLPNRRHIVLTRDPQAVFPGCEAVHSAEEALARISEEREVFVIGGASVYRQFYPLAGKLYLTLVHREYEADTFFRELKFSDWEETFRKDLHDGKNGFDYSFINYTRKAPPVRC